MKITGGSSGIGVRRGLALLVIIAMALSLMVLYAVPAQSLDTGVLRVKKQAADVLDEGGDPETTFNFTSPEKGDFTLQHLKSEEWTVAVGESVTVTEGDLPDGWYFEDIDCESPGNKEADPEDGRAVIDNENRTVTMTLDVAGGEFKCDFNNESITPVTQGTLIVEKKADDDPNAEFSFAISGDLNAEFTLKHDEHRQFTVDPGTTITVTEVLPGGGWYLERINCDDENPDEHPLVGGSSSEEDLENNSVTMTLDAAGEELECSFDNEFPGAGDTTTTTTTTTSTTTTTTSSTTTTTPTTTTTTTTTVPPSGDGGSGTFIDDDGSIFEADIEWLGAEGVTKGCNPPTNDMFCPKDHVTREQMAAFIVRFLGLTANTHGGFSDVPAGSTFANDIGKLATAGITKGCNPPANDMFCPKDEVSREQMAAFLVRALDLTKDTHSGFVDVPATNTFVADIEKLATAGITKGCNPKDGNTLFCPKDLVTREQMAAFLHRAGPFRD